MDVQRNQILNFGKYKWLTVQKIFEKDPSYLLWANNKVDSFELNDYYYFKCLEEKENEFDNMPD